MNTCHQKPPPASWSLAPGVLGCDVLERFPAPPPPESPATSTPGVLCFRFGPEETVSEPRAPSPLEMRVELEGTQAAAPVTGSEKTSRFSFLIPKSHRHASRRSPLEVRGAIVLDNF